eukprot:CAMPEP_0181339650 /NCGR_PEP_ID=MMETSP1101-20121128/29393_1 /TAXON_ID=46948 /ORGANISM="Rhodomonas abbreviata, Strain Caron Lab Isolate" /LENGTH=74 /DNA_ID=CAMNT_0023450681 /DNA_START=396 /DNA_END=616 /DNA_ORIENTATION=-
MKAAVDLATKALPHHGSACRSNMQVFRVPPPYHSNEEAAPPLGHEDVRGITVGAFSGVLPLQRHPKRTGGGLSR